MARSLRTLNDISSEEFLEILKLTKSLKYQIKLRNSIDVLKNKVVGLFFEKPSTRTRAGFESAVMRLGGSSIYLPSTNLQLSRGEPVKDVARMFGGYFDGIVARVFSHKTILELAEYSGVPVINGLCDESHPTQGIVDLFTIMEVKGRLKGLTLAYIGDGNNVCHSLLRACAHAGMNMNAACPKGYFPKDAALADAKRIAAKTGSKFDIMEDVKAAAENADVLYADTWVSMGENDQKEKKIKAFAGYQINADLLKVAAKDVIVMHCLPAYRGYEITEEVLEGPRSVAWQQGENKMHAAAGILQFFLG